MNKKNIIKLNNVSKSYKKGITALEEVSFDAHEGEFFFLVGPSGAGKSTVIRLIIRQEFPSNGEIVFEDIDVSSIPRDMLSIYRQQIGIVFQDLKLIQNKTIKENVEFALEITGKPKKEVNDTAEYLLDVVGLADRMSLFPDALSGGEKQKTAIARALANDPKFFIADEPTGNLDPQTSFEILELLKTINSWGTTVMVVTHDKDIVDAMQTRVIHLEGGKIVEDTTGGYESKNGKKPTKTMKGLVEQKESKEEKDREEKQKEKLKKKTKKKSKKKTKANKKK